MKKTSTPRLHVELLQTVILPWLLTRLLLWKIAALWGLLFLGVLLGNPDLTSHLSHALCLAVITLLLITAFRLWDDVADIAFDRQHHKGHILVEQANTANICLPLYQFVAILLFLAMALLYFIYGWPATLGLLMLSSLMVTIYYTLPALTRQRELRNTLVLLKYPAMLIVLTGGLPDLNTLTIAATQYGLLVLYENYAA